MRLETSSRKRVFRTRRIQKGWCTREIESQLDPRGTWIICSYSQGDENTWRIISFFFSIYLFLSIFLIGFWNSLYLESVSVLFHLDYIPSVAWCIYTRKCFKVSERVGFGTAGVWISNHRNLESSPREIGTNVTRVIRKRICISIISKELSRDLAISRTGKLTG